MQDFYEVLGISKEADADTIKKAYRKLAMQYHPDRNPGDKEAEDKFKAAASAYDVLGTTEKKAQYDRFGHQAYTQNGRGGSGGGFQDVDDIFSAFGDVFGDLFGGGGGGSRSQGRNRNQPRRGSDLRYMTEVTFKEVIEGSEKDIEFDTEDNCKVCNGSGAEKGKEPITCKTCGGAGQVRVSQGFFQMATTCPQCQGQGAVVKDPCKPCRGQGRIKQHRKIKLTIPAGVDTGTRLRVSNEGEGGYRGGPAGDLYVQIQVASDARFERDGDNLYSALAADYLMLLLGGEVEVETVIGKKSLEIPKGTQVGERLVLKGEGIPSLRGSRRGDLIFQVGVEFPKKLQKEEEELLRQIAQKRGHETKCGAKGSFFSRKK